jgi:Domain of unknown function (DUF4440)
MKTYGLTFGLAACALCLGTSAVASDTKATNNATAKWMIEQETAWAEEECSHKAIPADLMADDFRGTSPGGQRYTKAQARAKAASDTSKATDCRLLQADVRFFGSGTAIIYGSETALETPPDGKPVRHCLIWTDTWLSRNGKWQIVAAQDTLFKCPPL